MSDWDWTVRGWQHAEQAASWLLGALAYVALLAAGSYLLYKLWTAAAEWIYHRVRVIRVRRQVSRSGRLEAPGWNGAA